MNDETPDVIWGGNVPLTDKQIARNIYNDLKKSSVLYEYNLLLGRQKKLWYKFENKESKNIAKVIVAQLTIAKVQRELIILLRKDKLKKIEK